MTYPNFTVWAPNATHRVRLLLDGELHAMERTRQLPDAPAPAGWWQPETPLEAHPGSRYEFVIDRNEPRPDPRALRMPDGPHGASEVFDTAAFVWTDASFTGASLAGAIIYELHVGTFTAAGTLDAAIARLDHLVDLGVTIVELMPLATFPGTHGWGYDGVGLYAVHEPYGGPAALQRFVDAAHARGLGVCLDIVYNHLGPDGNYLAEFGPYFTDHYDTPWGQAINLDGPQSDDVRAFILDNASMWLHDFHIDALRLDAVHELIDTRALHILEALAATTDALSAELGRPLSLIAEDDRNDPRTTTPRGPGARPGGLGIHAQWTDDIHHALHVTLTGETQGYYADFAAGEALTKTLTSAFFHDGTYSSFRERHHGHPVDRAATPGSRFVASLQTHDQVGNRCTGDRLSATLDAGALACGAALLLTSPFTPMLFMGEEWGATTPWQYFTDHTNPDVAAAVRAGRTSEFASHGWNSADVPDPQHPATFQRSKLDWDERDHDDHARLLDWYRTLIALRHQHPELRDPRLDRVVVDHDVAAHVIVVERGSFRLLVNLKEDQDEWYAGGEPVEIVAAWDPDTEIDDTEVLLPGVSVTLVRLTGM